MKNMTLKKIAEAVNGVFHTEALSDQFSIEAVEANGVFLDSRKVGEGDIFIATRGEHVDGHSFIDSVFDAGALGVICEQAPKNPKGPYIVVKDSFQALRALAEYYRALLPVKVVGITGSVGKTSTKEFVASVLSKKFCVLKTEGNYNNEIGLPLTVLRIQADCEIAVLEMGISNFGEMHRLSRIAKPDVCLITNIGQCHLENLGTRDGILRAKSEIFDFMQEGAGIFLNGDDDKLVTIRDIKGSIPVFFGSGSKNAVYADQYENRGLNGSRARIHIDQTAFPVEIPLPGEHMLYDALAAAAVGAFFGLTPAQIQAGIREVEAVDGRSHVMRTSHYTLIDDCYNANPISVKAALDLLSMTDNSDKSARKIAILGDMFELGAQEEALHREVGVYAAQKGLDVVICVGKLCKSMFDGAQSVVCANSTCYYFADKEALFSEISKIIQKGDLVLVKASHAMHFEEIIARLS
ncbi:MAG: UDP-N-acetylmuramoyl-tripeptide--D-alanyl-D-alanine ligase [Lachnospiraceae bacterium]|jgi:UDP-N-acetylmuramoyl-tripeptide--D-alanyl-D-alanine ligase|nr:UDP-N-acetylmuramoyl-tripeptide--D-alanyl-D-alanine ligase [Lachnospiraceae bacterium]